MVNLTDTFTRVFGRKPSEEEIAKMMQAKARIDEEEAQKKLRKKYAPKTSFRNDKPQPKNILVKQVTNDKQTNTILKLLSYGLSPEKVAESFKISTDLVIEISRRYKLK